MKQSRSMWELCLSKSLGDSEQSSEPYICTVRERANVIDTAICQEHSRAASYACW
jgi:hypothetical protein